MPPDESPAGEPPALAEARLTHVALPCADLEATLAFYTSLTPLVVVARHEDEGGRSAWLSNDHQTGDPFVLVIAEVGGPAGADGDRHATQPAPVPTLTPFAHLGIEVPRRADVDAIAARGRELGCLHWAPRQMAEHIGYICALVDPDGNVVEFSHDQKVFSTVRSLWNDGG